MSNPKERVILMDDPEGAKLVTVEAWQDINGRLFVDEQAARYSSATHRRCECGEITRKHFTACDECRYEHLLAKYKEFVKRPWDGVNPVCTYDDDRYFFSEEEVLDHCDDVGCAIDDLMLVHCRPEYAYPLIPSEIYEDILPEDEYDLPPDIEEAFKNLNRVIARNETPLSWMPTNIAVDWWADHE